LQTETLDSGTPTVDALLGSPRETAADVAVYGQVQIQIKGLKLAESLDFQRFMRLTVPPWLQVRGGLPCTAESKPNTTLHHAGFVAITLSGEERMNDPEL
jgi:hypothetical protein